ncbi:ABC transporter substrate-binding protein [Natronospirillum operosum]|uniref:ABC transporter substrate-binding protein n=1 Tax=Natronospirillum operosum TaxID=2759953 RepID=A0A4Z0W784_9GAMM|nr:ABC transporter substrate-binding protein [Natronospirillum operosum]TGG91330.1 ABC transporter substrate-binding protein [Natronospirillum operosum]
MTITLRAVVSGVAATALALSTAVSAETLRWANVGDSLTFDPHAQNHGQTHTISHQVYDSLIYSDHTGAQTAGLATDWYILDDDPEVWEFQLREGVTFHEGQSLTADDVVFSFERALQPNSDMRPLINTIVEIWAEDDYTVRMRTDGPNPLLANNLTNLFIMSREWAEANNVTEVQDYSGGEENYAVRNANGTGPYRLVSREADVRTEMELFEDFWGMDQYPLEVSRIVFTPIQSGSTRAAAILSGEIDFLQDPPVQDVNRLQAANDIVVRNAPQNRSIFFGMDQGRSELRTSNIQGENPFADRRVRQAMDLAIDRNAIQRIVMRGQSAPAGMIAPSFVNGYEEELDRVTGTNTARARELMAEAGYEDGFSVTMTCTNDRYIEDEGICQAVTGMLGQIGVQVNLNARPNSIHFAELQNGELDFYLLGWGVPTLDSHYVFDFLLETKTDNSGAWNFTGWSNEEFDALSRQLPTETDLERRNELIAQAWRIAQEEVVYLPIHHQVLNWAMRSDVVMDVHPEDQPMIKYLTFE